MNTAALIASSLAVTMGKCPPKLKAERDGVSHKEHTTW